MSQKDFDEFVANLKDELVADSTIFDLEIPDGFVDWFVKTGEFYNKTYNCVPAAVNIKSCVAGNCFQNSQLVALDNKGFDYYEGVLRTIKYKTLTHHGFNVIGNAVIDITHLCNKKEFEEELKEGEYFYFGVVIPSEFISKYPQLLTAKFLNNPLLVDYFNYAK